MQWLLKCGPPSFAASSEEVRQLLQHQALRTAIAGVDAAPRPEQVYKLHFTAGDKQLADNSAAALQSASSVQSLTCKPEANFCSPLVGHG